MNLEKFLNDWIDVDLAEHYLAQCLGILPIPCEMRNVKWIYWTNNILGDNLFEMLERLVIIGFLEKRKNQYRVSKNFKNKLEIEDVWYKDKV